MQCAMESCLAHSVEGCSAQTAHVVLARAVRRYVIVTDSTVQVQIPVTIELGASGRCTGGCGMQAARVYDVRCGI